MLIIEKLQKQKDFSKSELFIAEFILNQGKEISDYSVRSLAEMVYVAPSTIIRLCKKLGYQGYDDFKAEYIKELDYIDTQFGQIDVNFPFSELDSTTRTANAIGELYKSTINDTLKLFSFDTMDKVVNVLARRDSIHVFSLGTSLDIAYSFKEKMIKIGKNVVITDNLRYQIYDAYSLPENDVAIIISYSGESANILQIAKACVDKHIPIVAITSFGENSLSKLSNYKLYVSTKESMFANLGDYSTHLSVLFLLDIIYAEYFKLNFKDNYIRKEKISKELEENRHSDNPIINKDKE
jgi:Transcriptional regulators